MHCTAVGLRLWLIKLNKYGCQCTTGDASLPTTTCRRNVADSKRLSGTVPAAWAGAGSLPSIKRMCVRLLTHHVLPWSSWPLQHVFTHSTLLLLRCRDLYGTGVCGSVPPSLVEPVSSLCYGFSVISQKDKVQRRSSSPPHKPEHGWLQGTRAALGKAPPAALHHACCMQHMHQYTPPKQVCELRSDWVTIGVCETCGNGGRTCPNGLVNGPCPPSCEPGWTNDGAGGCRQVSCCMPTPSCIVQQDTATTYAEQAGHSSTALSCHRSVECRAARLSKRDATTQHARPAGS